MDVKGGKYFVSELSRLAPHIPSLVLHCIRHHQLYRAHVKWKNCWREAAKENNEQSWRAKPKCISIFAPSRKSMKIVWISVEESIVSIKSAGNFVLEDICRKVLVYFDRFPHFTFCRKIYFQLTFHRQNGAFMERNPLFVKECEQRWKACRTQLHY